jgi:hypothetical protein
MSTDPAEFAYLPRTAAPALSRVALLGWILTGISLAANLIGAYNYWAALHAAHTYMVADFNKDITYMMVLAPVMELNVGLAIVGACMLRGTGGRLTGSLAVLLASAVMVCSTLLVYGIPAV